MTIRPKSIPAGEFKAHCLAPLDKVARTCQPLIVTKRGKPVAKVVPTKIGRPKLSGSVKFQGNIVDPVLISGTLSSDRARYARVATVGQ